MNCLERCQKSKNGRKKYHETRLHKIAEFYFSGGGGGTKILVSSEG